MKLGIIAGLLAFALLAPGGARAATYYVSPGGVDTNPGSIEQPFRTVQVGVNALQPGDTAFVRVGTYNERVVFPRSGLAGQPITLSGYGEETAVIDGTGFTIPYGNGLVDIHNQAYITVARLTVINSDDAAIYVRNGHDILIRDNHTRESHSSGIGVWASHHITVDHNTVVNARNVPWEQGGHEECISIASTHDFEVMYNEIYFENMQNYLGAAGIDVKESSYTGSVHHNYVHDFYQDAAYYLDAWRAATDGSPSLHDVKVYNNKAFQAGGISLGSERGGTIENIEVFNNVVIRSGWAGIVMHITGATQGGNGPRKNINIYHNTIYESTGNGGAGIYIVTSNVENIVIRNNLVAFDPKWVGQITLADPSVQNQVTVENNITYGRKLCSNDFPNCYNYSNITLNPQFVNPAPYDLHLQAASPARDAGSNLNLPFDFDDNLRPQGTAPDIGAYEYTVPPPAPGDYDQDGNVDFADFRYLIGKFDNPFTIFDLNRLIEGWGI